ncbi:unnamed protein product [Parascedosporium putredinis]|uniref:Uncharacterized protein n=1 Tax=Parascedosporium putredinis TaxID=1442378 RepID=A0A9P1H4T0_9PEZI|nr:unnamed protein product [Parascedosporium putredinis]CAI7996889.1 unnamed protein product [Parascedosporium putredinis]
MLTGSIANWPRLIQQSYDNIAPGGWFEISDITFPIMCDDDTFPKTSDLNKWSDFMLEASQKLQRSLESAYHYREQLEQAGFVNVRYKELGGWACENIAGGASGLSLALFTRGLGWTAQEVEVFLAGVRKDMMNVHMHTYYYIITVYGQKPEDAGDSPTTGSPVNP